jgi:hypothetical protein
MLNSKIRIYLVNFGLWAMFLFLSTAVLAQEDNLFLACKAKILAMPDYDCEVEIKVDVDFIKIPVKKGLMSYSKENGLTYKLKGFGFLPKKSFSDQLNILFSKPYTVIKLGKTGNSAYELYKIIPNDINSEIVLCQISLNPQTALINEMDLITKEMGAVNIKLKYNQEKFAFPSESQISFDVKNRSIPASLTGDIEGQTDKFDPEKLSKAMVKIVYLNYVIKPKK